MGRDARRIRETRIEAGSAVGTQKQERGEEVVCEEHDWIETETQVGHPQHERKGSVNHVVGLCEFTRVMEQDASH